MKYLILLMTFNLYAADIIPTFQSKGTNLRTNQILCDAAIGLMSVQFIGYNDNWDESNTTILYLTYTLGYTGAWNSNWKD